MVLEVKNISVSYGMVRILWGVSFNVNKGELVSIIGPNGAGKTTLVNTITGLIHPLEGEVVFENEIITHLPTDQIVKRGISLIPEGRKLFPKMSVAENLLLGAYPLKDSRLVTSLMVRTYDAFPVLAKKEKCMAETLSGGEQQMLAIGRGLMSNPKLLILDEPSLGLAPILVEKMMDTICNVKDDGVTVLLVEQNIQESLMIADRGYVLEEGKMVMAGAAKELLNDDHIKKAYLGA